MWRLALSLPPAALQLVTLQLVGCYVPSLGEEAPSAHSPQQQGVRPLEYRTPTPASLRRRGLERRELSPAKSTIFRDGRPDLWNLRAVEVEAAWQEGIYGQGIVVAVIDSGVEESHPDLQANLWSPAELGTSRSVSGALSSLGMRELFPRTQECHGTAVAGIIGAVGDNKRGVIGMAPKARIMSIRGASSARALRAAVDRGARVVNMSWFAVSADVPALTKAIEYAHSRGVVMVAAAGNSDSIYIDFPASHPYVIAVGGWSYDGKRAYVSNHGPMIDVVAPGVDVPTTFAKRCRKDRRMDHAGRYGLFGGTSSAAPHVAGLAALLLSANPDWSPDQVAQAIRVSARDVHTPGFDLDSGQGLINVRRALLVGEMLPVLRLRGLSNGQLVRRKQQLRLTAHLRGTADKLELSYARLEPGVLTGELGRWQTVKRVEVDPAGPTPVRWRASELPKGWYYLRLVAHTDSGLSVEDGRLIFFR